MLLVLLFLATAIANLMGTKTATASAAAFGYNENSLHYLGAALLLSTCLYVIPKYMILGAILLTGWLGGAIATHVIQDAPFMISCLPIVCGLLVWLSVILRSRAYSAFLPW